MAGAPKPLYLITDGGALRRSDALLQAASSVLARCSGSVYALQLREQVGDAPASDEEVLDLASALLPLCTVHGAKLIINRRLDLAVRSGAHGVQLGCGTSSLSEARGALGHGACIGYSAHSVDEAASQAERGADYLLLAPVYPPSSKPSTRPPLGLEALERAARSVRRPVFALGGITPERAGACRRAGAAGVAVIGAVFGRGDPGAAAEALLEGWTDSEAPGGAT